MKGAWVIVGLALMLSGTPVAAQTVPAVQPPSPPAAPAAPVPPPVSPAITGAAAPERGVDAGDVRGQLSDLLGQYPPALRQVLRLSPSLAANADYMRPYPELSAFLVTHPEVHQNPAFYFGTPSRDEAPGVQRARVVSDMMDNLVSFLGLMSLLAAVTWFSRSLLDHQRWKRALKVQADAHAKVVERLSSTEDVLAYAQTAAGRQFLESGAPAEPARPGLVAPIGRILWSVQVGTVTAVLGVGIMVSARMMKGDADLDDVAAFLRMMGLIGLSIGIGFLVSAGISYVLSQRLGLLQAAETQHG